MEGEAVRVILSGSISGCHIFAIRRGGKIDKKPVYVALGINREGKREVLGFYEGGTGESATFWEEVLWDIKRRGVKEVLLYVGDGLSGLSEAGRKVYSGQEALEVELEEFFWIFKTPKE